MALDAANMNSDQILAELDAQYQELIQSVQLEGLSTDDQSEQSSSKQLAAFRHESLQNVSEIIKKYEQTIQKSRGTGKQNEIFLRFIALLIFTEFYENEIKQLEDTKRKIESKYIESKKKIKLFEAKLNDINENHRSQIDNITVEINIQTNILTLKIMPISKQQIGTKKHRNQ